MCDTCFSVRHMSVMVQIRNMPEDLHRTLKARAAKQGQSLSDYLLAELRQIAELPTLEEMHERLRQRSRVNPDISSAQLIREERDAR
jgi:plasmid stability protein